MFLFRLLARAIQIADLGQCLGRICSVSTVADRALLANRLVIAEDAFGSLSMIDRGAEEP